MAKGSEDGLEKKRLKQWLSKNQLGHRLFVAISITIVLAFFIHFREIRIEVPEQGSIAKRYMVAQVDFEFPDDEATQVHKQEAIKDISSIFIIEEKEVKVRRAHFETRLIEEGQWRSHLPKVTFEEVYNALDAVQDRLISSKFTSERTIKKMQELKFNTEHYFPMAIPESGAEIILPTSYWEKIERDMARQHPQAVRYVVNYFSQLTWNVVHDREATSALQQGIAASIEYSYTKIYAGSRILSQGQKVTPSHISKISAMKKVLAEGRKLWDFQTILGSIFLAVLFVLVGFFYFRMVRKEILYSMQKLTLFATIVILTLILTKISEYFLLSERNHLIEIIRFPLFVPFAAILITVLLGADVAIFTSLTLAIIMTFALAMEQSRFLVLNGLTGIMAIIFSKSIRKRKAVFSVSLKVWLSAIPIILCYSFIYNSLWSIFFLGDIIGSFVSMAMTAILVVGLLPVLETIFHIMTDISLMEYMDPNNELLRRLSLEAPGTYQHSLVVGSLAEAAAQAIGANGLFCRVSTLYHDIGKLFNPHYFTENQMGGFNIHQLLTPIESTQVIIAHVPEGEALARKHGLPQSFIDIIREHHGTTLVYFFYSKQLEQMGGDTDAVEESQFRYPGPKPRSKESAIIMIADTIEAASRSLEDANEEAIAEMVDRLVGDKAGEGQFDDCQLTFEELGIVKKTIAKTLAVTRHLRIKYPERKHQHI